MSTIPIRSLGRTRVELSTLGFGGAPLGDLFDAVPEDLLNDIANSEQRVVAVVLNNIDERLKDVVSPPESATTIPRPFTAMAKANIASGIFCASSRARTSCSLPKWAASLQPRATSAPSTASACRASACSATSS